MKYYELKPEHNHFESIVADITHKCNMECSNCYLPNRNEPDMDINKLYELIKKLPNKVFIRLIGAEPTLRKDLPDIIKQIIKLGHKPSLTTNGLKLSSLTYCQELRKAGLKYLLISMNGAGDDNIYKQLDGGKYAKLKIKSLINSFKSGFVNLNTGTIIAKGINENTIKEQINLTVLCAKYAGVKAFNKRLPPVLRMKTIAPIGRYIKERSYTFEELLKLVSQQLGLNMSFIKSYPVLMGSNKLERNPCKSKKVKSYSFPYNTELGPIYIDWTVDNTGVPDPVNIRRGRITQKWTLAPAFEHVKRNEGGY